MERDSANGVEVGGRVKITWTVWTDDEGTEHRNVVREGTIRPLPDGPADRYRGYVMVAFDDGDEGLMPRTYVERGRVPDGRCRAHRRRDCT